MAVAWTPPDAELELLARLPFPEAQIALAGEPLDPRDATSNDCGWHGSSIDPALGAFAVAERDGPLDPMLGERLRVTSLRDPRRSVYVLLHDLVDPGALGDDLTLTRRAFLELAALSTETLRVRVEVLA